MENVGSPVTSQRSTAVAGFASMTSAWLSTELSVSFGALTVRFGSQASMVKNDRSVTAVNCAGVAGKAGAIAPHHLIAVV